MGTVYGENRRFTLQVAPGMQPKDWSDAGIELTDGGAHEVRDGILAIWDTSRLPAQQFYTLKLTATTQDGTVDEFLDATGLPRQPSQGRLAAVVPVAGVYPAEDWRNLAVADIDHDGQDEIILMDHGNDDGNPARLLVYRADERSCGPASSPPARLTPTRRS